MMTFEQLWAAAEYNWLYWVSYAAMLGVPLLGAIGVAYYFSRRPKARRVVHVLLALTCFLVTAEATVQSIGLKWQLRAAAATTQQEHDEVAMRDTGNLAFAPIVGGFCGLVAVSVWAVVALIAGRIVKRRDQRRVAGSGVPPTQPLQWTGPAER